MTDKLFINDVNFFQFAIVVEEEILRQTFSTADGGEVALSSRRAFGPSGHRLEISGAGYRPAPHIALDCRSVSNKRLMVDATCNDDNYRPALVKILADIRLYWDIPQPAAPHPLPMPASKPRTAETSKQDKSSKRSISLPTAMRVAEAKYRMLVLKLTKTTACDQANVSHHTYNRWKDDETVEKLLQEMIKDPPDF
jgi:hypothetical protein